MLYAGTEEPNNPSSTSWGNGVYCSMDYLVLGVELDQGEVGVAGLSGLFADEGVDASMEPLRSTTRVGSDLMMGPLGSGDFTD